MTVLGVLTVSAVLENTLPSFRLSFKIPDKEVTVTVSAVSVVKATTPFKLNPLFRDPERACNSDCRDLRHFTAKSVANHVSVVLP